MPKGGQRAIVRCRDDHYKHPFPALNLAGCRALHVDGHQPDAAIHYAKICHEAGVLTSLDGGGLRSNTHDLLEFIDVAVVAERLCEQMHMSPGEMLQYLRARGCKIGGVTMGPRGLVWYDETRTERVLPALHVPEQLVIDTNGAGDIFHGAYIFSYLTDSAATWIRTSDLPAQRRPTPSSTWATRQACPLWPRSTKRRRVSASDTKSPRARTGVGFGARCDARASRN